MIQQSDPSQACGLTSVLGKEDCKGALLKEASGIVVLGKDRNCPVVYAIMIPRLFLVMLDLHGHIQKVC